MIRRFRRWWNAMYWRGYQDGLRECNEMWGACITDASKRMDYRHDHYITDFINDIYDGVERELGYTRKARPTNEG